MAKKENIGGYDLTELMKYEEVYFEYVKELRGIDLTYYGNWQRDFAQLVVDMAEVNDDVEPLTLLDVGCATGLNARAYDELEIFEIIYGTDVSKYMIDLIPEIHKDYEWNSQSKYFISTPAWDHHMLSDGSIDLITCTHVLEHLPNKTKLYQTLREFKRILHPNGTILIIVPTIKEGYNPNEASLHKICEDDEWWGKTFKRYFNESQTEHARFQFERTTLRPARPKEETFAEVYDHVWSVYRLVHK